MATSFATKEELATGWRPLTESEFQAADTLLADASYWLRSWYPSIDTTGDEYGPKMIVRAMVRRALLNSSSEGVETSTRSETTGPWSNSTSMKYSNPDGSLFLTKKESELLDRITGRASGAVSMTALGL